MDLDRCITRSPAASAIRTRLRAVPPRSRSCARSEEHTSELQSRLHLVCRLLLEKKKHSYHVVRPASEAHSTRYLSLVTLQLGPTHTVAVSILALSVCPLLFSTLHTFDRARIIYI